MSRFEGRRVLVTGASGGIGRAVVDRLCAEGAVVAGVDLVLPDGLQLDFAAKADVCNEASIAAVVEATVESLGGLDTVVAAAGIEVSYPFRCADHMARDQEGCDTGNLDDSWLASGAYRCRRHPGCSGEQRSQDDHRVDAVLGGSRDVGANLGEALGAFD